MCVVFGCETSVHSRVPRVVCTCMHARDPLVAPLHLPARFVYRAFSVRGTGACSAPPPLRNPGGFPTSLLAGVSTPARQGRRWLPPAPPFCVAVALQPLPAAATLPQLRSQFACPRPPEISAASFAVFRPAGPNVSSRPSVGLGCVVKPHSVKSPRLPHCVSPRVHRVSLPWSLIYHLSARGSLLFARE